MKPANPDPVKLVIAALYSDEGLLEKALKKCAERFGPIDYRSEAFPFDVTDYYDEEMGAPIFRMFVSFETLVNPGDLATFKITCNTIEDAVAVNDQRKVNLDVGYLDFHKYVLASAKFNEQKIYLNHGIYADPTLYYRKGTFHPYSWSLPDFKSSDQYYPSLLEIRQLYKNQMRSENLLK